MTEIKLSVVIPTRNRPEAIERLLRDLVQQSLSASAFEVIVVDDGSSPALQFADLETDLPYALRVLRRENDHGAHQSRSHGVKAALGQRVMHLDDDVTLLPEVLRQHAETMDDFAVGPILYHPDSTPSPYIRYQTKFYEGCVAWLLEGPRRISAEHLYICNSSGPRLAFGQVMEAVCELMGAMAVPGEGFDECLIEIELKRHGYHLQILESALIYHIDTKTLDEARQGHWRNGMTACRMFLEAPHLREVLNEYMPIADILIGAGNPKRRMKARLIWRAPWLIRTISGVLTYLADHGPQKLLPARICYLPLATAFWQGVRSVEPDFRKLEARLSGQGTGG